MRSKTSTAGSWIKLRSWSYLLSLILLSTSLFGCPRTLPSELPPAAAVCRKWNREQLIGYFALTQLAQQEKATGDEAHVAAAVEAMGALLHRCGVLK